MAAPEEERVPQPEERVPLEEPLRSLDEFRSRSTARIEEEAFAEGTDERRARLHAALEVVAVDVAQLTESAEMAGSSRLTPTLTPAPTLTPNLTLTRP